MDEQHTPDTPDGSQQTNPGAAVPRGVRVNGSQNTVLSAGDISGPVHIGDKSFIDSQFTPLRLEEFSPERWVNPPGALELVDLLIRHRLLIIAGSLQDKVDCARHLAYLLRSQSQPESGGRMQVLERCRGRDPQRIENALAEDNETVLLLTDMSPGQLNTYSWAGLRSLLRTQKGYVILTTDHHPKDWGVTEGSLEATLWKDLQWDSYYGVELLCDFLSSRLVDADKPLPEGILPEGPDGAWLASGLSRVDAVERLRTPERVRSMTDWLLSRQRPSTFKELEDQLKQLAGEDQAVRQWFQQFDARHQLLILGLTLLDGLSDNLVFTGLELLVENIWRSSNPALVQYDYGDVIQFGAYFRMIKGDGGEARIESESPERRKQILEIAWDLQRRRLLAALPVLTEMIRASAAVVPEDAVRTKVASGASGSNLSDERAERQAAAGRAFNRSPGGTKQLHQALVDSFTLIGLLSIEIVEPHFLELAADESRSVQRVAARALAAWREEEHEEELFTRLQSWWAETSRPNDPDSRIARLRYRFGDPHSAIRAAVALTVGFAALYDPPNQMASPLLALMGGFLEERNVRVREAVGEALRHVVAWHFRQLEPFLRTRVLKSADLVLAVAQGIAEACRLRPEETLAILDNWRAYARAEKRRGPPGRPSVREHVLAAAALAYGYIDLEDKEGALRPEVVISNLRSLLMEEFDPFVRRYAFYAIQLQAARSFESVIQLLQDLLAQIHLQDRPAVVNVFAGTYLFQRRHMRGGNRRIPVGEALYDVWTDSPRPLTDIEAILYGWLLDSSRPVVQQLAVEVFDRLGRTDLEIAERKLPVVRPQVHGALQATALAGRPQPQIYALPVLGRLAVYCVAPRKPQVRSILGPLLAEMITLQKTFRAPRPAPASADPSPPPELHRLPADVVFERWAAMPNEATRAVAHLLRRAFSLYRWRWFILFSILSGSLFIYQMAPVAARYVREALRPAPQSVPARDTTQPAVP